MKKKVGNATRTKNQIRNSKSRGAQFEYSVFDSLKHKYKDLFLTKELGFVRQYDLISDTHRVAIECKFHKSISWNRAKKWYYKLEDKAPKLYFCYLIFKSNQQPVLVMFRYGKGELSCMEFEDYFKTSFVKHKGHYRITVTNPKRHNPYPL